MTQNTTLSAILLAALAILLVATPMGAASRGSTLEAELESAVREWFADRFGTTLLGDEALAQAAREHSEVLATGARLETHEFLRQAMSRHGVLDPFPYVFHGQGPEDALDEIERRLLLHLAQLPHEERALYTHLAVGIHRSHRGPFFARRNELTVTVLLTQRSISFSPIPSDLRPGDRFLFEGEVHPPFSDPEILLTSPRGETIELRDHADDRLAFRTWVQVDGAPGEYQLEVLGDYDLGPRVLALCSLFPRQPDEPLPYERLLQAARNGTLQPSYELPTRPAARTETEAESLMLQLVNEDRSKAGLPPLLMDERLSLMARRHSRDMRDRAFFAHVSPRTGHLADRAEREAIAYRRLGENIAVGVDVREAQKALLRSPGHRKNLLDPHFTHIGIGVAFDEDAAGRRRLFVTQDFLVPADVARTSP
jgi:uncharacterized protein YkwD